MSNMKDIRYNKVSGCVWPKRDRENCIIGYWCYVSCRKISEICGILTARDVTRPQTHEAEAEAEATTHEAEAEATTHEAEATTHEAEAEAEAEAKTHLEILIITVSN